MGTTEADGTTRPNPLGAVNGLSREVIEALPAAVYMTDAEGRLTFYNEAAAELWGCHPELGESKFCGSWKLYWPDGTPLPHDECPMAMALHQKRPIRGLEAVAERPDGTRVPFIPYPTPLFDASGRLTGAVNMLVDISERKQAEEKLRKSERESRELLGALPAAIYVTDAGGHITYCNQSAVDLWGARPALGMDKWCDLARFYYADGTPMPREDCPTEIALMQGRLVQGREALLERSDGTRMPIVPYPMPLRDEAGSIVGVVNMSVDISELKEAERALAERNLQLGLAERAALVGSFAYDVGCKTMQISAGYAAIHGFPAGVREISRSEWAAGVHHDDLARLDELRNHAFRTLSNEYSADYRAVRPCGELRWIDARVFISYRGDGRPQRLVGVNIDVTGRKRAEEQQLTLLAELDHRVKNVLAAVSAVAAHTKNTSRSMGDFVAALDSRIHSMASTHELLSSSRWQGVPLRELLRREFAPYASNNNTCIEGDEVILTAEAAQTAASVLHELATNAAKYGAFSKPEGRVSVRWHRAPNGQAPAPLVIEWLESGGPPVEAPSNSGYGRSVITELVRYELGGTAHLVFSPEGVRCWLDIPAKWLARAAPD